MDLANFATSRDYKKKNTHIKQLILSNHVLLSKKTKMFQSDLSVS